MRIRCKQNAPERMLSVISKSHAFCLSFHWRLSSAARMYSPRRLIRGANSGKSMQSRIERRAEVSRPGNQCNQISCIVAKRSFKSIDRASQGATGIAKSLEKY